MIGKSAHVLILAGALLVGGRTSAATSTATSTATSAAPARVAPARVAAPKTIAAAQKAVLAYLVAIEKKDEATLSALFLADVTYNLQFPATGEIPAAPTSPAAVVYKGKSDVIRYFRNGFQAFGSIQHDDVKIDVDSTGRVVWVRYRQRAGIPWAGSTTYENVVVERLILEKTQIREIQLFENPEAIRAVPVPPGVATTNTITDDYLIAIERKDLTRLEQLFGESLTYSLQFPGTAPAAAVPVAPAAVDVVGKTAVIEYFRNGFQAFGNIVHQDTVKEVTRDGKTVWVTYRQEAGVPWATGVVYKNKVVERLRIENGKITQITLYENPDAVRGVPPFP
jgi:ketosteroid isomerase-like protein